MERVQSQALLANATVGYRDGYPYLRYGRLGHDRVQSGVVAVLRLLSRYIFGRLGV